MDLLEKDVKEHISAKNTLLHSLQVRLHCKDARLCMRHMHVRACMSLLQCDMTSSHRLCMMRLYHDTTDCEMHVQRSNAVLAESRIAVQQHVDHVDSMRSKLQALQAEAFEAAAEDALKVREQVGGTSTHTACVQEKIVPIRTSELSRRLNDFITHKIWRVVCQGTEIAALQAEVTQLKRQLSEGSASFAILPSLEKQCSKEADNIEGHRGENCGQRTGRGTCYAVTS